MLFKDKLNCKFPNSMGFLPHLDGHFYWKDKNNLTVVQNCLGRGVNIELEKESLTQVLTEKIFVFTGSLNLMNRNEAKNMVENAGGKTKNSITKKFVSGQYR